MIIVGFTLNYDIIKRLLLKCMKIIVYSKKISTEFVKKNYIKVGSLK